jgi:hypothetical protein
MLGFLLGILLRESGPVLVFHRNLGVVRHSQSFFRPNSNYPLSHRSIVALLKLVELHVPSLRIIVQRLAMVNRRTPPFTEH